MNNGNIHLLNCQTGFSLQSIIHSDDSTWVLKGVYHTNITTRSKAHKFPNSFELLPISNEDKFLLSLTSNNENFISMTILYSHKLKNKSHNENLVKNRII